MRISLAMPLAILALASFVPGLKAQPASSQAVAQTPPMGWNSWNFFFGKVTDKDIRASADQVVATGMKDAGSRSSVHWMTDCAPFVEICPAGAIEASDLSQMK